MKSIVFAGSLAQKPGRGGHTWVFLQYLLGFRKLGWDVLFIDRLDAAARKAAMKEIRESEWFGLEQPTVRVSPHATGGLAR